MSILTKEKFAAAFHTFEKVEVDVTEWGEIDPATKKREKTTVFVRELSAREKDRFEASLFAGKGKKRDLALHDMRAKMAVLVCCDADGNAIFEPEDVEWLTQKPVRPLSRIYNAAMELNGYSEEDEEELLKN
jgi:hypothetical protein